MKSHNCVLYNVMICTRYSRAEKGGRGWGQMAGA